MTYGEHELFSGVPFWLFQDVFLYVVFSPFILIPGVFSSLVWFCYTGENTEIVPACGPKQSLSEGVSG